MAERIDALIRAESGRQSKKATNRTIWKGLAAGIVDQVADNWDKSRDKYKQGRIQHYLSAEFLVGRSMLNNLINLGIYDEVKNMLAEHGKDLDLILDQEYDAALGNGGLGRLAACFMDSAATHDLPVIGQGILYRYGLFRQAFENGFQVEYPDSWMEDGYPFMVKRDDMVVRVHFNDMDVIATPFDLPITGYDTDNVNTLRLWRADPAKEFDFNLFNSQRFDDAVTERNKTEDIWRVLYPNDTSYDGKVLRVRQQYFFVSAALQSAVRSYKLVHGDDLSRFAEFNSFQMNDTHPVIAIPELMRILVDENQMSWEQAWSITTRCFAYTNHTILSEALEKWETSIFNFLFPRILEIIMRIDMQFRNELENRGVMRDLINYLAPLGGGQVRMAWIACYASHSINGVAALHTDILKAETLKPWYDLWPEKFSNKTNGVTPRRWLRTTNPRLAALLTEKTGSDAWVKDLSLIRDLDSLADDENIQKELIEIKRENKLRLTKYVKEWTGIDINPDAIFDIQIKRLHEYKRQLLNAFYILDLYFRLKSDPNLDIVPRVFFFGAKAAPGYVRAKSIIKFINEIARIINNDSDISDKIKVVFVPNYNVSKAEIMIPAADISEQISLAGKEASGTGNMKFMMNGALTLGTYDGANVEIAREVGDENIYIFGVRVEHLPATLSYYNPRWQYENIPGLKRVIDSMTNGFLDDLNSGAFQDLVNGLLYGTSWEPADPYYVLGEFDAYRAARDQMAEDYRDQSSWARKAWINITRSGVFSSDRTVRDYAGEIWKIESKPIREEA